MERLNGSVRVVFLFHIVELALAYDKFTDDIRCSHDGDTWIYTGAKGNLFIAVHIIVSMMASGVARAVFIKTPKATGIFADINEGDSDTEEKKEQKKKQ